MCNSLYCSTQTNGGNILMRFQVLMAVVMKTTLFWDVAVCSLVEVYWCFRGSIIPVYCPDGGGCEYLWNAARLNGTTTKKAAIFILTAVKTSNPAKFCTLSDLYSSVMKLSVCSVVPIFSAAAVNVIYFHSCQLIIDTSIRSVQQCLHKQEICSFIN
jgi:hypothetical protein